MGDDDNHDQPLEVHHRSVDPTDSDPNHAVLETIAEFESREVTDLPPMYNCIDHLLDHLFSNPPSPTADVEVIFSYFGYRITIDQDGDITLRHLEEAKQEEQ